MPFTEDLPEWTAAGTAPPAPKRAAGWQPEEKPPAGWFNWLFGRAYACLLEIRTLFTAAFHETTGHAHTGAAGDGPILPGLVLLAEQTLSSNAAAVTITGFSARAYAYLLLEVMASTTNSGGDLLEIQLNQDTAANYHGQRMSAKNTTVDAARGTGTSIAAEVERGFGQVVVRIASPTGQRTRWWTENLGAVWTGSDPALAEAQHIDLSAGLWKNTADVTRLDIGMLLGDLRAGSVIRLWGVQ